MLSAEGSREFGRQAMAGAGSKRRFPEVTRTAISPPPGLADASEPQAGTASLAARAASPVADNFRKSRLVRPVDIFASQESARNLRTRISYLSNPFHASQNSIL